MEQEQTITAAQIRAARGLIGYSQENLAMAAGLSTMTIKRAEGSGSPTPAQAAFHTIRTALEAAGVEFIAENGGGPGVRLRRT